MLAMNEGGQQSILSPLEYYASNDILPSSVIDSMLENDDLTSELQSTKKGVKNSRKRKRNIFVDKFEALLKSIPSISCAFEIKGKGLNSKLYLKLSPNIFRFHKSTLCDLLNNSSSSIDDNSLLAKLIQENPSSKDEMILGEEILHIILSSSCGSTEKINTENIKIVSEKILEIAHIISYSDEDKTLSCWEVKDKFLLGKDLCEIAMEREKHRLQFYNIIYCPTSPNSSELASDLATFNILDSPMKAQKIQQQPLEQQFSEQQQPPPFKKKKEVKNSKLTDFFTIIPTTILQIEAEEKCKCDSNLLSSNCCFCSLYFQPFPLKPGISMKCPSKFRKINTKLIQFHTTFHPPYYGSINPSPKYLNPRNPFKKYLSLIPDYSHDSDDEWGDDAEIEDAESINASDEEEDDLDDEEGGDDSGIGGDYLEENNGSGSGSGNSSLKRKKWIISDDDDEVDDEVDAVDKDEGNSSTIHKRKITRISIKKIKNRKEKIPIISGPYNNIGSCGIRYERIIDWPGSVGDLGVLDPFNGCWNLPEVVFEAPMVKGSDPKIQFTDEMVPSLAIIANRSSKNVSKLYNSFCLSNGNVSKRAFEMRLNQICYREKGGPDGNIWLIRQEYLHYVATNDN